MQFLLNRKVAISCCTKNCLVYNKQAKKERNFHYEIKKALICQSFKVVFDQLHKEIFKSKIIPFLKSCLWKNYHKCLVHKYIFRNSSKDTRIFHFKLKYSGQGHIAIDKWKWRVNHFSSLIFIRLFPSFLFLSVFKVSFQASLLFYFYVLVFTVYKEMNTRQ